MAVNKVIFGGTTLVDMTMATVTPEDLAKDVTAFDKSGTLITGTNEGGSGESYTGTDYQLRFHVESPDYGPESASFKKYTFKSGTIVMINIQKTGADVMMENDEFAGATPYGTVSMDLRTGDNLPGGTLIPVSLMSSAGALYPDRVLDANSSQTIPGDAMFMGFVMPESDCTFIHRCADFL